MEIEFVNAKTKKIAENFRKARKLYGKEKAEKIILRINELKAANTLKDIKNLPQARLHPLKINRRGQFSIDTIRQYRIIIKPTGNYDINNLKTIKKIKILDLNLDTH